MKDDVAFVRHILDEVGYIMQATGSITYEQLLENETLKRAVVRSLEIIGEAAKIISSDFKKKHPLVEWKEMAGLRDKLIHFYFGVDWKIVWDVVRKKIPALEKRLKGLLTEQN